MHKSTTTTESSGWHFVAIATESIENLVIKPACTGYLVSIYCVTFVLTLFIPVHTKDLEPANPELIRSLVAQMRMQGNLANPAPLLSLLQKHRNPQTCPLTSLPPLKICKGPRLKFSRRILRLGCRIKSTYSCLRIKAPLHTVYTRCGSKRGSDTEESV